MTGQKSHKLWGGRFSVPTAASLEALNRSIGIDFRLWPHDIRLSKAWAMALWNAGVLSLEESQAIEAGLTAVGERIADGALPEASDEDIHTMIDRMLHAEIGDVASRASHRSEQKRPGCNCDSSLDHERGERN